MALPPVVATLIANNREFNAKIDESAAKMDALAASGESSGARLSNFMNKATTAVIAGGAAVAVVSLKMASDFQTATTELVTGAGESEKNIGMVRNGLLSLAPALGSTPTDLAKGMYLIESAGYHGAQGLQVLKAAAEGAKVGAADMSTVSNALTTALHDYNIPASQATAVTSALVATVAAGKTHMEDLANALGRVLPVASALKLPLQNVLGSVAALTNAGYTARLATTNLSSAVLSLTSPSAKAAKIMGDFGISSQQLINIMRDPSRGLSSAFQLIVDQVGKRFPAGSANYITALKDMTGTTAGLKVALDLTGQSGNAVLANTKAIGQAMQNGQGQVQGWSTVTKELSFQLDSLKGAGSSALVGLGDWLLPKATDVAKWVNHTIDYLKAHPLVTKIASDAAIGLFAASVAYKVAKGIESVVGTVSKIFGTSETAALTGSTTDLAGAVALNTAAVQENTVALGGEVGGAAVAGGAAGGLEAGAIGGTASKLGVEGLTIGKAIGVAAAGAISYQLTMMLAKTSVGGAVVNQVANFGGLINPIHDLTNSIATLTGAIVSPSAQLSASTAAWAHTPAGEAAIAAQNKKISTRTGAKVTVSVRG
jgi:TP901 family phage tail tape measure protein